MKNRMIIVLCVCLTISVTACSQNNNIQESETTPQSQSVNEPLKIENQVLISSSLKEALTDDVVFCVKTYVNYPPDTDLSAKTIETFKHEDVNTYLYVVPRYSGSSIKIESIHFDDELNEFVTTGLLFESVSTEDYALVVQADLLETEPRLRVTVAYEDMTATYTPAYDGRGDTIYPYVKNGVLLAMGDSSIPTALPGTSVLAAFQKPDFLHYTISNITYDAESETYAVLYAVSNYDGDKPWLIYYYKEYAQLNIQIFDKHGGFLRRIETNLLPNTNSKIEVIPSNPCTYRDGILTFFSDGFHYIFFNTLNETYTEVPAERCVVDGEYFLFDDGARQGQWGRYVYSLYYKNQLISKIDVDIDDPSFQMPGNRYYKGERNDAFSLDSKNKTAVVGNDKLTFFLDFNTQTWRMERHYTRDHLEDLVATSPDGRWEIYLADTGGAGDGFWADLVSLDTNSGEITYLTNEHSRSAAFGADNLLLFNKTASLELIDVEKSQVIDAKFGIDCAAKDCYINGVAYDPLKDWFLVAWHAPQQYSNNNHGEKVPIMLDIYNRNGTLVKSMDTGYEIHLFYKNWVVDLSLEPDGNGFVTISDTYKVFEKEPMGKVKYD